jgi:flavin-dependent dehydrogenase
MASDVFCVGDSAGHCLPLTGEGIRPAAYFAQQLADLLNRERTGEHARPATRSAYSALQARYSRRYHWLRGAQRVLRGWPDPPIGWFFRAFEAEGRVYRGVSRVYWELAVPA